MPPTGNYRINRPFRDVTDAAIGSFDAWAFNLWLMNGNDTVNGSAGNDDIAGTCGDDTYFGNDVKQVPSRKRLNIGRGADHRRRPVCDPL